MIYQEEDRTGAAASIGGMGAILEEDPESLELEEQQSVAAAAGETAGKRSRSLPQEEEFRILTQKLRELERSDSGLSARYLTDL